MDTVAVVVPYYKGELSSNEEISLLHLERYLSKYKRIVVKPVGLKLTLPGYQMVSFPNEYFESIASYSKLLLSSQFYEAFSGFDYILIYQLDCLVFSKDLDEWCDQGYDYIGSPLFQKNSTLPKLSRVGNGGLSLRRVQSFLDALNSPRYLRQYVFYLKEFFFTHIPDLNEFAFPWRWWKKAQILMQVRRGAAWYTENYGLNEDLFWSDRAKLFHPGFKVAPVQTALQFSFERNPRYCFEKNNQQLPFGCHAWAKWDRAFWEPYLLT